MIRAFAVLAALSIFAIPAPSRAEDPAALARALAAVGAQDWAGAADAARGSGPLAFDIVEWQRLRAGQGSLADYADFATRRADWPGMALLRKKGEAALQGARPDEVVAYFAGVAPQTGTGALALAAAHQARGEGAKTAAVVAAAWRGLSLTEAEELALLADHGAALADHHGGRMAWLLDQGEVAQARRMLARVSPGTRAVAEARIALQTDASGVDALIKAIPERMLGSAGLARDRAVWRMRKDADDAAADLVLERSASAEALGEPALWAKARAGLARRDLREGNPARAYRLAARHHLASGSDYADLEWLAGYAALKLGDAPAALGHFQRLEAAVASPISLSRAGYWQGRAQEALGQAEAARAAYAKAAQYQTAFYGLLASERAGLPLDPALANPPELPDWRGAGFTASSVFQAGVLLQAAGDKAQAERFFLHLAESLSGDEISRLARLALDWREPHLGLMLAKAAAQQGVVLPAAYFPLSGLERLDLGVPKELALSIARRESEFDAAVVSAAGARGLMQVMPETARRMAARLGLPYEAARLTTDPEYNARLGAAYLAGLRDEFGSSPVLVAAGYNAGPGRPRRWMAERGDPRAAHVDVVDWIEAIPFTETRNYVMRVAESLPVYRARLTGQAGPVRLSDELKGRD